MKPTAQNETWKHDDTRGRRSSERPDLNMTRLAATVGVCPSYLSKLFKGLGNPSVPLAQKLAREMGMPLDELLGQLEAQRVKRQAEIELSQSGRKRKKLVRAANHNH